jgi:lipid-binding SYLF domain-containing protein
MSASRVAVPVLLALALVARPTAQEGVKESDRITAAIAVLGEVMGASDSAMPGAILEKAEAIAVFPSLVKAGFVVGGSRGHGVISVRDPQSGAWSSPAFLTITGGSIGFQIGAQAVDLVLVVQNRRGLDQLLKNQFKIGADASVAAGPVGRDASASTDIQLRAQILSYSRTRGLFAGVTINGSTIRQDRDANERFYGIAYRTSQIVTQRLGGSPEPSAEWRATLAKHAGGTP